MITKKKVVSRSTDPSQGLEGVTEIRKPGVRFPVEVRMCFGVRMRSRWFKRVMVRCIKRIKIKMGTIAMRLMRITSKMFGVMLER